MKNYHSFSRKTRGSLRFSISTALFLSFVLSSPSYAGTGGATFVTIFETLVGFLDGGLGLLIVGGGLLTAAIALFKANYFISLWSFVASLVLMNLEGLTKTFVTAIF